MNKILLLFVALLLHLILSIECKGLTTVTFGSKLSNSAQRLISNSEKYDFDLNFIETESTVTKSNKLALMKDFMGHVKDKNEIVLFINNNSLLLNDSSKVIEAFKSSNSNVILSSASECQPDESLKNLFPTVGETERQFIGKEGIIGYANVLLEILSIEKLGGIEDLQYYLSKLYVDEQLKEKYQIKIDSKSEIFQNLDASLNEVSIEYTQTGMGFLVNALTHTTPVIVQSSGNKIALNSLSNYLGDNYDPINGCKQCIKETATQSNQSDLFISISIDRPTPFLSQFLTRFSNLSYSKSNIHLYISNNQPIYEKLITKFIDEQSYQYAAVKYQDSKATGSLHQRKQDAVEVFKKSGIDNLLLLDSVVQLTNPDVIQSLLSSNKSVISPKLSRRQSIFSNFWGNINEDGYYKRSFDYLDIVNGSQVGLWNVAYVNNMILIKSDVINMFNDIYETIGDKYDETETDMNLAANLRNNDVFMYIRNDMDFGYIVNPEDTTTEHLHNDLWEVYNNPLDWKENYINEQYDHIVSDEMKSKDVEQPCRDVFWWPFLSEKFAKELIEEMENFGEWSSGLNKDNRLEGGYEAVPTRDIHMRQIDWEGHWNHILKTYVYPMQIKLFEGYYDEPSARMNFVVRYKPSEQDRLRPHQDASSYTLNIALNRPHIDYEGGGTKFNRYNCSVVESRVGWTVMSPGRVTHQHEGLPTTKDMNDQI